MTRPWVNTPKIFTYPLGVYPPHVTGHMRESSGEATPTGYIRNHNKNIFVSLFIVIVFTDSYCTSWMDMGQRVHRQLLYQLDGHGITCSPTATVPVGWTWDNVFTDRWMKVT
ncbi:hypothetical protein AVEN_246905-1 [Araneus ventricosus]|uniref:Uncharacterized protein n=1 Tax=Araneus ventricosus TaxID=182803 RepID=A0A4Y2PJL4_ARAVE|nr:hypothetical protein AVEN_246905-1 [Araneus ventricosus]